MLPTGISFSNHRAEARYLRTGPQRVAFLLFLLALLAVPFVAEPYIVGTLTVLFITLVAVLGLEVTVGEAGQINIAQSAFVGVGSFATAKLSGAAVPFWAAIPLAGLTAGVFSILFALPAMRVKGFYLALTTLAAQVVFPIIVIGLPADWLGGPNGIAVEPISILGYNLTRPSDMYYLALAGVVLSAAAVFNVKRSRFGRALRAVRDNDIAAEVLGIDTRRTKIEAFFLGAVLGGIAGALNAYYLQYVTTEGFTLFQSVWYLGMLIVGGASSTLGAILGTVFVTILQEVLHGLGERILAANSSISGGIVFAWTNVMLGAAILATLILEPRGLAHRWSRLKMAYRMWPFSRC